MGCLRGMPWDHCPSDTFRHKKGWKICLVFADDIKLLGMENNEATWKDLARAYGWPVRWDLPLNLSKCQQLDEGEANLLTWVNSRPKS